VLVFDRQFYPAAYTKAISGAKNQIFILSRHLYETYKWRDNYYGSPEVAVTGDPPKAINNCAVSKKRCRCARISSNSARASVR